MFRIVKFIVSVKAEVVLMLEAHSEDEALNNVDYIAEKVQGYVLNLKDIEQPATLYMDMGDDPVIISKEFCG